MAGNEALSNRNRSPQDEFYTQLADIEAELRHYKDQLRGKVVLCNCDDPYESHFFKYFAMNFNHLGLKKLIATAYSGSPIAGDQLPLFDLPGVPKGTKARAAHKIEIGEVSDANADGAIDLSDVEYLLRNDANVLTLLDGDGDFRSAECVALLDEADVVVTNPPFSLFREYITQLVESGKKFLVLGDQNAITYDEVFAQVMADNLWFGYENGGIKWFQRRPHLPLYRSRLSNLARQLRRQRSTLGLDAQSGLAAIPEPRRIRERPAFDRDGRSHKANPADGFGPDRHLAP